MISRLRDTPGPHETTEVAVKRHMASLKGAWSELSVAWAGKGKTQGSAREQVHAQMPIRSGTGFTQALASNLRSMITG